MPNTHATLASLFGDIADAIRNKKGESSSVTYVADDFPTAISNIPTGGGGISITGAERSGFIYAEDSLSSSIARQYHYIEKSVFERVGATHYLATVSCIKSGSEVGAAVMLVDASGNTIETQKTGSVNTISADFSSSMPKINISIKTAGTTFPEIQNVTFSIFAIT